MTQHTAQQLELAALVNANSDIWFEGYDASTAGKTARACPYTPSDEPKMTVWLSGHVTSTDDRAAGRAPR